METLTVTLKQHTPLIHFQHDQEGATLRASEVKPKLDKFLLNNYFENNFEDCKTSLVGYSEKTEEQLRKKYDSDFTALNYKLKICTKECNKINVHLNVRNVNNKYSTYWRQRGNNYEEFPFLLCNMGGKESSEELFNMSMFSYITLIFTTKNVEIEEALTNWIDIFFATNNFGQRSSKGFGSFSVIDINGQNKQWEPKDLFSISTRYLKFNISNQIQPLEQQYQIFATLDFYWKCLKSGINYTRNGQYPDRYIKSFLWCFFNPKGTERLHNTWEKRFIKQQFHLTTPRDVVENNNQPTFARALLGCPSKYEYKNYDTTINIKHSEPESEENFIARIPSPIIFKPIIEHNEVRVYIMIDANIERRIIDIQNRTFDFSDGHNTCQLNIPDSIDYHELIKKYHFYLCKDENVAMAMYGDNGRDFFIDTNPDLEEATNWFIPLDFRWNNIIGENVVKIYYLNIQQ